MRADLIAENKRLKAENETLRAQIASARADGAWGATLKQARELPRNWEIARLGMIAYLADKAAEAGFGRTPEGIDAWRAAEKRKLRAELRARVAADPSERAHIVKTFGAAYLEDEPEAEVALGGLTQFAEPAPVSDDPMVAAYLPRTQATASAIVRAAAIASGEVTPLPVDPVARQILRAHQRATDPDGKPL